MRCTLVLARRFARLVRLLFLSTNNKNNQALQAALRAGTRQGHSSSYSDYNSTAPSDFPFRSVLLVNQ